MQKNQTLRQYLESALEASSDASPSASDILLEIADNLKKSGKHDIAEFVAAKTLDILILEASHREDFLLHLDKKLSDKTITQLIKSFYEQQGYESYKESSHQFKVDNEAIKTFCYFFKKNEYITEVTATRCRNPAELMVSTIYKKIG